MNEKAKLIDIIRDLNELDPDLTIYAQHSFEGRWTELSQAIVEQDVNGYAPENITNQGYQYFLEVFIALEVIEDWLAIQNPKDNHVENSESLCRLLIFYAENDYYPDPGSFLSS